jgi:hypothetical protein
MIGLSFIFIFELVCVILFGGLKVTHTKSVVWFVGGVDILKGVNTPPHSSTKQKEKSRRVLGVYR